jgi:hypothetical protein
MNSTAPSRAAEIDRYIAGVSAALADLPDAVRQELLEDLPDHLAEIAADDPASLYDRLGSPASYAIELRAATGVDAGRHERPGRMAGTIAALRPHARSLDETVGRLIGYDRLLDFLVQLRPAWWVVRGYVVAMVLLHLIADPFGFLPHYGVNGVIGWSLVLVLVGLSIRIGRRPVHLTRRFKPTWLAAGAIALLVAAYGLTWIDGSADYSSSPSYPPSGVVGYEDPNEVYVYTENGRSITNVRVYNRRGEAVPIGVPMGCGPQAEPVYREQRGCIPETDAGGITPQPSGSGTPEPGGSGTPSPSAS